jgi:AcrR family transcriptional regulator
MQADKTDRRVKYTVSARKGALVGSLKEKHISKISVKALCELADVNRSTFYAHFQDQYDLLYYVEKEALDNITRYLETQDMDGMRPVSFRVLTRILDYVRENADLFRALLSDHCEPGIHRDVMRILEIVPLQVYDGLDARKREYMNVFGITGCVSILQKWLNDDMPESAAEVSGFILQVLYEGITGIR